MLARTSVLLLFAASLLRIQAEHVITNCTEAALLAAIQQGGPIRFECDGVIGLSQSVTVTKDLQLDATGHSVALDGRGSNGIFDVFASSVVFSNLVFTNAVRVGMRAGVSSRYAPADDGRGGALVLHYSTASVSACRFAFNQTIGGPGVAFVGTFASPGRILAGANAYGGAIFSDGSLVNVEDCWFERCVASGSEAVYPADPFTSFNTRAGSAWGGGLYATNSVLKLKNVTFSACNAAAQTGDRYQTAGDMKGGAVAADNSDLTFTECRFYNNTASHGALDFYFFGETAKGGAIFSLGGSIGIDKSLFLSNSAIGGRIAENDDRTKDYGFTGGGALWLSNVASIQRSSFVSNFVQGGSGYPGNQPGGDAGPSCGGAIASFAPSVITDCTFAFNIAAEAFRGAPSYGAAIYSGDTVAFSTIASNQITSRFGFEPVYGESGAGITVPEVVNRVFLTLQGTVLADNLPVNLTTNGISLIADEGANISTDSTFTKTRADSLNTNPQLGPMNTFATYSFFPPQPGSPAIDLAANLTNAPRIDQLGFPRTRADSGAIEWQGTNANLSLSSGTNSVLQLSIRDPSYSLHLEESDDLQTWIARTFDDFSPQAITATEQRRFFRLVP